MNFRYPTGFRMKYTLFVLLTFFGLTALAPSAVLASTNGYIIFAYYFDSPLNKAMDVVLTTNGDTGCMYDNYFLGKTHYHIPKEVKGLVLLNVKKPDQLYYKSKSSSSSGDLCATSPSYFHVQITSTDSRYSWTTVLQIHSGNWFKPNSAKVSFFNGDPPTQFICVGQAKCNSKYYQYHWSDAPTIYVLFRPSY